MPSPERYDVIVLGVGGMGSAALYHLAKRGLRVLGLERYDIPHAMGSSHGVTRIIRLAYFEHPTYVPLLVRAYELWRELEREAHEDLLFITGSLDIGRPGSRVLTGSISSCAAHGLPHEILDRSELERRFPAFRLPGDFQGVLQPEGGFLLSERCIVQHAGLAMIHGAVVRGREAVRNWGSDGRDVRVHTTRGEYVANRLVVTAGAWSSKLLDRLAGHAMPERQVLAWFQPHRPELYQVGTLPVFNLTVDEGHFYGFPQFGVPGFKIGLYHHLGEAVDPDAMDREPHDRDERPLRACVERYFPDGAGPTLALKTCMFTNTVDEHFVIDTLPDAPQVAFGAGFSGHGFKFASVVGEILADLAEQGKTRHDISRFALARL